MSVKVSRLLSSRVKLPTSGLTDYGLSLRRLNLAFDEAKRRAATEEPGDRTGVERIPSDPQRRSACAGHFKNQLEVYRLPGRDVVSLHGERLA
jgi:hypothetical protein